MGRVGGVVPAAGVEPATFRSGGERSNPLSYAGNCFREAKDNIGKADSGIWAQVARTALHGLAQRVAPRNPLEKRRPVAALEAAA
jgi:hypothetical protein